MPTLKLLVAAAIPALSVLLALGMSSTHPTAAMAAPAEPTPYSADHSRVNAAAEELPATF